MTRKSPLGAGRNAVHDAGAILMQALILMLMFLVSQMPGTAALGAPDRWIQYGKPNEPSAQDEYHRVDWEKLALVIFDTTPGREGIHLWSVEDGRVVQLGTTSPKSDSAEDIRTLINAESQRWIKGFVYGGPGRPGQPDRLDAYCDLSKAKVVAAAHPIEAQGNVFIKVSFDDGGSAPTLGISDERAYSRIRGIMEASVIPGKRHKNTREAASYPRTESMTTSVEPPLAAPTPRKVTKSNPKQISASRPRASRSTVRKPSYTRFASRGFAGKRHVTKGRRPSSKKQAAKSVVPKKSAPPVGRYLP